MSAAGCVLGQKHFIHIAQTAMSEMLRLCGADLKAEYHTYIQIKMYVP